MTLTCDLNLILGSWVMCLAHCLTERNIWRKFKENHPKGSGDMEKTRHSRVNLLTLRLKQDQIGTSCVTFGQK